MSPGILLNRHRRLFDKHKTIFAANTFLGSCQCLIEEMMHAGGGGRKPYLAWE